jgi:TRAP transporter 4TM/12TM fusion protein
MWSTLEKLLAADPAVGPVERRVVGWSAAFLAVLTTGLVLYEAYFGTITALVVRSEFFSAMASAGLLLIGLRFNNRLVRAFFYIFAVLALPPGPYLQQNFFDIVSNGGLSTPTDRVLFVMTMVVVIVLTYMTIGWSLVVLAVAALLYAVFGYLIPGRYGHGGYDLARLTATLFLSTEGVYGIPMGVAVDYIFLFALLGTFLMKTGTGELFVDLARAMTGRTQGGPGLSAVLASSMLGTINGSAVANVVTVGTFTIPLMKRVGYSAATAGAIEAAASAAGQILPPIMGAAAFLMAEIMGVPYSQIAIAAIIPAALYVLALLVAVRLEAGRLNLARDDAGGLRIVGKVLLRRGYLLLPLVVLVALLTLDVTPMRAAVIALGVGLVLMPWSAETRLGPAKLLAVCVETVISVLPIVAAVAAAGVVIGVLNLTGLGLMLSGLILQIGGGNLLLVLVLTALTSFVLGMGLPTSAAYLLLAVLVAPALEKMGVQPIVAHMFIFYYGLVSAITPPVALAAYAAAGISGAGTTETGIEAVRLGFVKLLVPFLFVSMPGLLMLGGSTMVAVSTFLAAAAVVSLSVSFAGWLVRPLMVFERLGFLVAAVLLVFPAPVALDAINVTLRPAGFALLLVLTLYCWRAGGTTELHAKPNR